MTDTQNQSIIEFVIYPDGNRIVYDVSLGDGRMDLVYGDLLTTEEIIQAIQTRGDYQINVRVHRYWYNQALEQLSEYDVRITRIAIETNYNLEKRYDYRNNAIITYVLTRGKRNE